MSEEKPNLQREISGYADISFAATMVKISEDEMRRMNKTSIAFRDGSGYLGYLEAHHMLHCVVRDSTYI